MPTLPMAQWQEALDQMEASLASALRSLDRAEERWEMAAAPSAGEGEPPGALERLETELAEWDARLHAADAITASVEKELTERATAVEGWRALFARWEELIKRGKGTSPAS